MTVLLQVLFWLLFVILAMRMLAGYFARRYRLRQPADEIHFAETEDGWYLALHRYRAAEPRRADPVVLCHGLAGNHHQFDLGTERSLARWLAGRGFDVWCPDLRGAGMSRHESIGWSKSWRFDFDHHLQFDVPAVVRAVLNKSGQKRLFWGGHSMGGMLGYAWAGQADREELAGLINLAVPVQMDACHGFLRLRPLLQLASILPVVFVRPLARLFIPLITRMPNWTLRNVYHRDSLEPHVIQLSMANLASDMSSALVGQFLQWGSTGRFASRDGQVDYLTNMGRIQKPVLIVTGERDTVAPPDSVTPAYERLTCEDKQLNVLGEERGDDSDFGHGDIVLGKAAEEHVFPLIGEWLEKRSGTVSEIGS